MELSLTILAKWPALIHPHATKPAVAPIERPQAVSKRRCVCCCRRCQALTQLWPLGRPGLPNAEEELPTARLETLGRARCVADTVCEAAPSVVAALVSSVSR